MRLKILLIILLGLTACTTKKYYVSETHILKPPIVDDLGVEIYDPGDLIVYKGRGNYELFIVQSKDFSDNAHKVGNEWLAIEKKGQYFVYIDKDSPPVVFGDITSLEKGNVKKIDIFNLANRPMPAELKESLILLVDGISDETKEALLANDVDDEGKILKARKFNVDIEDLVSGQTLDVQRFYDRIKVESFIVIEE